jgi:hypothetical protein
MGGVIKLKESRDLIGTTFQFVIDIQDIRMNGDDSNCSNISLADDTSCMTPSKLKSLRT